jgi:hypothetical protein
VAALAALLPAHHPALPCSALPRCTHLVAPRCSFEKYGVLSASLRTLLDAPPEVDMDEYQQRSRVQVGGVAGCCSPYCAACAALEGILPCGVIAGCCIWCRSGTLAVAVARYISSGRGGAVLVQLQPTINALSHLPAFCLPALLPCPAHDRWGMPPLLSAPSGTATG